MRYPWKISINMSWSDTSGKNRPFMLRPAAKDYIWGGTRLNDDFNLGIDVYPFAEAWVCSTHPDGESTLDDGRSLCEVLAEDPSLLGSHPLQITGGEPKLPILIKFIDARLDLSVQVHPDDDYAKEHENGSWGKTEMWYVLSARKNSELIYGFRYDVDADRVRSAAADGTIGDILNHVPVKKNDLFFIDAGTVHAIGAGCLIVEIQQSSNITYRLYDYNRVDANGNRRPLHIDKALDVVNFRSSSTPRQPMRVLRYSRGCASELLSRCKYFQAERLLLNTENRTPADFRAGAGSFHVLLVTDGCGNISGDGVHMNFYKGDCIFVPANSVALKLHGQAQILNVSC